MRLVASVISGKINARVVKLVIHARLKILWPYGRVGSTPTPGTATLLRSELLIRNISVIFFGLVNF